MSKENKEDITENYVALLKEKIETINKSYIRAERSRALWKAAAEILEDQQEMPDSHADALLEAARFSERLDD